MNKPTTKIKTKNKTQELNVKEISRNQRPYYDCEHGSWYRILRKAQNKDKYGQSRAREGKEDEKLRPKAYRILRKGQNKDKYGQSQAREGKEDEKSRSNAYPYSTDQPGPT
ncbi:hypothetical protein Tco_0602038 [Tanacetum coccineum]